jgi:hypothetical protein
MRAKLGVLASLVAVALVAASCGMDEDAQALAEAMQAAAQAAQQQQGMQPPPAAADPDAALFQKIGGYIDCYNACANTARDSYNRYLDWVDKKKGPTCKETYISYGLYEIGADALTTCNNAAQQGRTMQPPLPEADAAAAQVAALLAQLQPLNDKAETYYEQEDYKDDNCAFAKQSHAQLISLFDQFIAAADKMKIEVDKVKDQADLRQLAHIEQTQGRNFTWQVKRIMIHAKKLVDIYPDGQDPAKVKGEQYLPLFAQFEPVCNEFEAYATTHKPEIEGIMWGSNFVDSSKELCTAAKFLRRDYESKKKKKKLDVSKFNDFINAYNSFIRDAGNLSI